MHTNKYKQSLKSSLLCVVKIICFSLKSLKGSLLSKLTDTTAALENAPNPK